MLKLRMSDFGMGNGGYFSRKQKIMCALGITTRPTWYCRLNGTTEPKVSEAKAIEEIFSEYGILEVWGTV